MYLSWKNFRSGLESELSRPAVSKIFRKTKPENSALDRFDSFQSIVFWLLDFETNPSDVEDAVLREIRSRVQTVEPAYRSAWLSTLLLGLWPTLEWIFKKIRKMADTDAEAAGAIWTAVIECIDEEKVWTDAKVAKRLMYAAWKKAKLSLLADSLAEKKFLKFCESIPEAEDKDTGNSWTVFAELMTDDPDIEPPTDDISELTEYLVSAFDLSEEDADLLIERTIHGKHLKSIAEERQVSYQALRQKYSRLTRRIRSQIENSS